MSHPLLYNLPLLFPHGLHCIIHIIKFKHVSHWAGAGAEWMVWIQNISQRLMGWVLNPELMGTLWGSAEIFRRWSLEKMGHQEFAFGGSVSPSFFPPCVLSHGLSLYLLRLFYQRRFIFICSWLTDHWIFLLLFFFCLDFKSRLFILVTVHGCLSSVSQHLGAFLWRSSSQSFHMSCDKQCNVWMARSHSSTPASSKEAARCRGGMGAETVRSLATLGAVVHWANGFRDQMHKTGNHCLFTWACLFTFYPLVFKHSPPVYFIVTVKSPSKPTWAQSNSCHLTSVAVN